MNAIIYQVQDYLLKIPKDYKSFKNKNPKLPQNVLTAMDSIINTNLRNVTQEFTKVLEKRAYDIKKKEVNRYGDSNMNNNSTSDNGSTRARFVKNSNK